jgi:hypothetical protein
VGGGGAWAVAVTAGDPRRPFSIAARCSSGPPPLIAICFTAWLSASSWSIRTRAVPLRVMPSSSAATCDTSRMRERANGPRSLTRTTVDWPFSGW